MSAHTDPEFCRLLHRGFQLFQNVMFCRSEADGIPALRFSLGEREATLPIDAVQRELGIPDDSDDGRMLAMVAGALDFVTLLRPGDRLPPEILSGAASWEPREQHRRIASARLRLQLVAWLRADGAAFGDWAGKGLDMLALVEAPSMRASIGQALERAAQLLGLADGQAVLDQLEGVAEEVAYIEALRDRLLRPLRGMVARLGHLHEAARGDSEQRQTFTRLHLLGSRALAQIGGRFDELDALTGEVIATLRNSQSQCAFIRSNRDWLYRSLRAWEDLLASWEAPEAGVDEQGRRLVLRTYQFLAPRFMPVSEWNSALRDAVVPKKKVPQLVW